MPKVSRRRAKNKFSWKSADWTKLFLSIIVCQMAGLIGSLFTTPAISGWYTAIIKPAFTPPNWVFAPVWTLLFFLMGVSLYLVWQKGFENRVVRDGFSIFAVQLSLNILWSVFFFHLKNPFYAFIEICVLWVAIFATIWKFSKIDRRAAYLLGPYLLWVTFAAFLNFSIWQLNPFF